MTLNALRRIGYSGPIGAKGLVESSSRALVARCCAETSPFIEPSGITNGNPERSIWNHRFFTHVDFDFRYISTRFTKRVVVLFQDVAPTPHISSHNDNFGSTDQATACKSAGRNQWDERLSPYLLPKFGHLFGWNVFGPSGQLKNPVKSISTTKHSTAKKNFWDTFGKKGPDPFSSRMAFLECLARLQFTIFRIVMDSFIWIVYKFTAYLWSYSSVLPSAGAEVVIWKSPKCCLAESFQIWTNYQIDKLGPILQRLLTHYTFKKH